MADVSEKATDALSLADAAALLRLGEDSLRELVAMGELPALSLNRKHLVLLREDVLEFIRTQARHQQDQRRTNWQARRTEAEFEGVEYTPRKPGGRRRVLPELFDRPTDGRDALRIA